MAVFLLLLVIYPVKCVTFKHHFDQNTFLKKRDEGRHVPGEANAENGERGTQKRSQRPQRVNYARKQLVKSQKKREKFPQGNDEQRVREPERLREETEWNRAETWPSWAVDGEREQTTGNRGIGTQGSCTVTTPGPMCRAVLIWGLWSQN